MLGGAPCRSLMDREIMTCYCPKLIGTADNVANIHGDDKGGKSDDGDSGMAVAEIQQALGSEDVLRSGGRVLLVSGYGRTIDDAVKSAYDCVDRIEYETDTLFYRKDIGSRAMK